MRVPANHLASIRAPRSAYGSHSSESKRPAATRSFTRLLFASFALLGSPSLVLATDWVELGPAPITNGQYAGRISAIACSPTDANRYFVAGADGGVWRTTDGGASWTPLTDHLPTTAIGALAIDPTDENVIYAGSGEANFANHSRYGLGLYKSTDGGDSWTVLAENSFAGRCFSKIVVHPTVPTTLYAAITSAGGFPALAAAKGHPQAAGPLGVFVSTDGGVNWSPVGPTLPALSATDLAIDPTNPNQLYAAIGHVFGSPQNGLYSSADAGAIWTPLAGGLPTAAIGRISLAIAPSNPNRLYALFARETTAAGANSTTLGAFRSDDAGATWASLPVPGIHATYGWFFSVTAVSPTNPDTVIFGGLDLVRSTNAGAAFTTITPPHVDMHAIAFDAGGRMLAGDDGGVHRSTNLGTNWTSLNAGLGTIQCYAGLSEHPTNDLIYFAGTQDNGTNRRNTESQNWTNVFGGDGGWTQVDNANPLRVFCEFQGSGNLYRSVNGGTSFGLSAAGINTADRNCFLPPFLIDPTNSNRMLYATYRVYRSTNGGTNWTPISGDVAGGSFAIRALAIAPSDPQIVYAATNGGQVLVSSDGGATFTAVLSDNPGWPRVTREILVHPAQADTVYVAAGWFGVTRIRRSIDRGQTFSPLDAAFPDIPVNVLAIDTRPQPDVLYAGADDGVYRSLDDGLSWARFGAGLPRCAVVDLRLSESRDRLTAATQGRGAWSIRGLLPGDIDGDGGVDLTDLAILLGDFGCDTPSCPGDANGDGLTNLTDLSILLANFGS